MKEINLDLPEEEKEPSKISKWAHENAMTHKDTDNRRMMIICMALCLTLIIVTVTLVSYYTSRTAMWNDTISKLTVALVEVCNAKGIDPP